MNTSKSGMLVRCLLMSIVTATLMPHFANAKMKMGQNLENFSYYSSSPVFANSMKNAKSWMTRPVGSNQWDSGFAGSIPGPRVDGYPNYVPFTAGGAQQIVHTMLPVFENGDHKFTLNGTGLVKIKGPGVSLQTYNVTGSLSVILTATTANDLSAWDNSGISQRVEVSKWYIEIHSSSSSDPIRNIQVKRPGYHSAGRDTFDTDFINLVSQSDTLRFMKWQGITNSEVTKFNVNQKRKDYYTQGTSNGVSMEHIVDLANQIDKNIWICVPHKMANNEIHNMAYFVADKLESGRICYIEYSNEVWNTRLNHGAWIDANTSGVNLPQKYGTRANAVFEIFRHHFQNRGKLAYLRRTLAGQNAVPYFLGQALITAPQTECLAVAPYFGSNFSSVPNPLPTFDELASDSYTRMTQVLNNLATHQTLAQDNGKTLLCYEGGQHYVSYPPANTNLPLVDRLLDFNRDWRIRNLYRYHYLGGVNQRGVDLFEHFVLIHRWQKDGSWGGMEYIDQPIGPASGEAIKEWALRDWAAN